MANTPQTYMQEALVEARKAAELGEVPVGAVIVVGDEIIARAHNLVETRQDATAHAEILAIREASEKQSNWRLNEASLFVTLEPCVMCAGAIVLSRIASLYFGAYDPKLGAVGSLFDLTEHPGIGNRPVVYPELCADESLELLSEFFQARR